MHARYVYYKVPRERLASVCAAVRVAQQAWAAHVPGLETQLMLRHDETGASGTATLMEIWTWPAGGGAPAAPMPEWASLEEALRATLGDALIGERHVELFFPAPG